MSGLFQSISTGTELSVGTYLLLIGCALLAGVLVALAGFYRAEVSKNYLISLVLLSPIVTTVILMVNGNIGTGIAVAGAFSLVRFRSALGNARQICSIFLSMAAGIACAAGYVAIAVLFALVVGAVEVALVALPLYERHATRELRITVPEVLNVASAFDDVFAKYTTAATLAEVKTINMGSLYKLRYRVKLKGGADVQKFIDALRVKNGNLEVRLTMGDGQEGEL